MNLTTLRSAAGLTLIATLAASATAVPTYSTGDDNVSTGSRPPRGEPNWDTFWVTELTLERNRQLYMMREQIAAMAVWEGFGPDDVAELRAPGGRLAPAGPRPPMALGAPGPRTPGVKVTRGAGRGPSQTGRPGAAGVDAPGDNRSLARADLWQGGVIPYTFSDTMMDAWNGTGDPSPEEINAIEGVINALAFMILIEQETPLVFVPFDVGDHPITGFLLWDSTGDGENGPVEDFDDFDTFNTVIRIGRNPTPFNPEAVPTTINHGWWQFFPSLIRSLGFAIGLDWEQRHPDRDTFIEVHFENIPPPFSPGGQPWPQPGPSPTSPGFPFTAFDGNDQGPGLFVIQQDDPAIFPVGDFDLDSMMLLDEFGYVNVLPMYTIRDDFRYEDLDGDGDIDRTPGSLDDLMFRNEPVYFSEGDLAAIDILYAPTGELCPADVDDNGVVNDNDILVYLGWYNANDLRAELTGDTCTDPDSDGIANNGCITIEDLVQFFVNLQQSSGCDRDTGLAGDNSIQPI